MRAYVLGYACLIIWGLASPTQEGRLFFFSLYFENLCPKIQGYVFTRAFNNTKQERFLLVCKNQDQEKGPASRKIISLF